MNATHLAVIRNLATDVVRKVRIFVNSEAELQSVVDATFGPSELIVAVPVASL